MSGDPKFGVVKTLVVDYSLGDNHYTVSANDGGEVVLGNCLPPIKILKAKYGPPGDEARTVDVREYLQKLVDSGNNGFLAAEMARPKDPAYLVLKTLDVEYQVDGKTRTWKGTDQMQVDLVQKQTASALAEPAVDASGNPCLKAWIPGRYEVRLASGKTWKNEVMLPLPQEIGGAWQVRFPKKEMTFEKLVSWSDMPDDAVKYFSGTATYRKTFDVPKEYFALGQRIYLDLGQVGTIAELKINGKDLGVCWKLEKIVDVTDALKANGPNELEIHVTNLWPNRLIGDEFLPPNGDRTPQGTLTQWPDWLLQGKPDPSGRETFCLWNLWSKNDTLLPSGLIGPVRLIPVKQLEVK